MLLLSILFYVFIVCISIQVIYYMFIFSKFAFAKENHVLQKNIGISILVCAKNEEENLKHFIPKIISQDYPKFEIILINDDSSDATLDVMQQFEATNSNVKVVNVKHNDAFLSSKKYALTLGIKASSNNFLLFTDADCVPSSNQWIKTMSSHFSNSKTIVLGYGAYKKVKRNFLNALIRFETLLTAIQYFSYTKLGMPYMAVGRNLAYRKEEFFNHNGFSSHMQIQSGDDDLFINQVATSKNTAICLNKNSFTESLTHTSLKKWFTQKKRHVSTAKYYKPIHKILLGIFYISQLAFWILSIALLISVFKLKIVLALIIVRFIVVYFNFYFSAKKLNEIDVLLYLPFLDLFLVLSQFAIFISNLTSKKQHWR